MEWSVDIIMKFLAYPLNWSWFYCYVWLTARSEHKKEGPFLPSTPTTYIEHVIWKFQSLKLQKMYTGNQWECCVYSQCQPRPFTPSLPWTSVSQRMTTYFPSKIHRAEQRKEGRVMCPAHHLFAFHSTTLMSKLFYPSKKRFWKVSTQRSDWQIRRSKYYVYGKN